MRRQSKQTQSKTNPVEDNSEVLREGGFGDGEHVKIEDRLISASLKAYDGAERDEVVNLFNLFAVFPEDVPEVLRHALFGGLPV